MKLRYEKTMALRVFREPMQKINEKYITEFSDDVSKEEVENALLALAKKNLHNDIENEDAQINSEQRKKLISSKAINDSKINGYNRSEHYSVAPKIEKIWRYAAFAIERPDNNGHKDLRIRRYVSAIRKGDKPAFSLLTVKKSEYGLKIYSVELVDENKLRSILASELTKVDAHGPVRSFGDIISALGGNVNDPNIYHQIVGKQGAAALDQAEEATTREVEARNVQTRMDMSWEDRQKTLLADTEDVDRKDQIFLRDGLASIAAENGVQQQRWWNTRDEKMEAVNQNFKKLIGMYQAGTIKDGELYNVMKTPLVLQLLNVDYDDLKVYGSFFKHSLRKSHPGMDEKVLEQIPEALAHPIMIFQGSKANSLVFALEVVDNNKATVIVPVEIQKVDNTTGAIVGDVINTAYGKDKEKGKGKNKIVTPHYNLFIDALDNGKVLYLDREKSTSWADTIRGSFSVGSGLRNALSAFIVSSKMDDVKTEADLGDLQSRFTTLYQSVNQGVLGATARLQDGTRVIKLFEEADESTFLHEMGHLFLMDLEELAALDETMRKDLETVNEWAEWHRGAFLEYKMLWSLRSTASG